MVDGAQVTGTTGLWRRRSIPRSSIGQVRISHAEHLPGEPGVPHTAAHCRRFAADEPNLKFRECQPDAPPCLTILGRALIETSAEALRKRDGDIGCTVFQPRDRSEETGIEIK